MSYQTEHFATSVERNARWNELRTMRRKGVVRFSDVRYLETGGYVTDFIVAYPPEVIETTEDYVRSASTEAVDEVRALPEVVPNADILE